MGDAYSQGQMVALGIVFLIFSTSFVGLRVWAKTLGRAGVSWDDHLIFVALVQEIKYIWMHKFADITFRQSR